VLNASAKSIRSRDERVFSQGARMDRMNMRVVREMIFFDQTFFLVGVQTVVKKMKGCKPYIFSSRQKTTMHQTLSEIQQKKAKKPFAPQKTTKKSRSSFSHHARKTTEHFCVRKTKVREDASSLSLSFLVFDDFRVVSRKRALNTSLSLEITHHRVVVVFIPSFSPWRDVFWISPFKAMGF